MTLKELLDDLEAQESLCCSTSALYNALRLYPETLFGDAPPPLEGFHEGILRLPEVAGLYGRGGLDDQALGAVAAALKLSGSALPVPRDEAELDGLLSAPGRAVLARLRLRVGGRGDPGVRHSVVLLPRAEPGTAFPALDSNGAPGSVAAFPWTDLARSLCGLYALEVRGRASSHRNAAAGPGPALDLAPRRREPGIAALLDALKDFLGNQLFGHEALAKAIAAHPEAGAPRALRGAVALAVCAGPRGKPPSPDFADELTQQAMADFKEVRRLEPKLDRELPEGLRRRAWRFGSDAFGDLAAAAVWPEAPDEWAEKVRLAVARMW